MRTNLAPDKHAAEDDLKTIEEIIADNYDCSSTGSPAFVWANGLDRRCCRAQKSCDSIYNSIIIQYM